MQLFPNFGLKFYSLASSVLRQLITSVFWVSRFEKIPFPHHQAVSLCFVKEGIVSFTRFWNFIVVFLNK